MARGREGYNPLLKSYPDSDSINAVSEGAEVLYVRLIAATDDKSRYYGDPFWVLSRLFTARMIAGTLTTKDVSNRIRELAQVGLLRLYAVRGVEYIELVDCFKKIRSDVKPDIRFPSPTAGETTQGSTPPQTTETPRVESGPDTERMRDESVTPTQPNPTTNPTQQPTQPTLMRRGGLGFGKLTTGDLQSDDRLQAWFARACAAKNPIVSELDRLNVWGAAERALEKGTDPPALFVDILKKRNWEPTTNAQERRAQERLNRCRPPPAPSPAANSLAETLKPKIEFHDAEPAPSKS